MVTIDDTHHYCTLINVFTVAPEKVFGKAGS